MWLPNKHRTGTNLKNQTPPGCRQKIGNTINRANAHWVSGFDIKKFARCDWVVIVTKIGIIVRTTLEKPGNYKHTYDISTA